MRILPVVVVVDVDPDWQSPGMPGKPYLDQIAWKGLNEGVPEMLRRLESTTNGSRFRFTWLVRSDEQMGVLRGDPAACADEQGEFLRKRVSVGDEVGWHPHLWRYSEREKVWFQETSDIDWIRRCLKEGHAALSRRFPIRAAKTGWTFHTTDTMRLFSDLGIQVDLSALPGMTYRGVIPGTDLPLGAYDWSRAPQEPYHPSASDYQVQGDGNALQILEAPNCTFPVGWTRRLYHRARGRAPRDFANPAKLPRFAAGAFSKPARTVPFVCYFHPEELLGNSLIFSGQNVPLNLQSLHRAATGAGMSLRPMTGSELVKLRPWAT